MQKYFSLFSKHWALGIAKIALAIFATVTIHFLGFFSTLSDNYFIIMTSSLSRRVLWELVSTLAETSLWVAIIFLFLGMGRAALLGFIRAFQPKLVEEREPYTEDVLRILSLYFAVLAVKYTAWEATTLVRLAYVSLTFVVIGLAYFVFFRELQGDTKWTRFAKELRRPELAIRALIAAMLICAYLTGKGLAWNLMGETTQTVFTNTGELQAAVIDGSGSGLLLMTEEGLVLMPLHEIRKIILTEP